MHSAIERFNAAIDNLRSAQLRAADLWREIDTPENSSAAVKRVPWSVIEEMDRRIYAVGEAIAETEAAANEVQRGAR